jgi:hypothetical protein
MLILSKKLFILIAGSLLISSIVFSQDDQIPVRDEHIKKASVEIAHAVDLGAGFGISYGGSLGVQVGLTAAKHFTFFATGGYFVFQGAWNVGIKTLFISKSSKHVFRPYFKGMYGCHDAIYVQGADQYNQVYLGWTAGVGMEFRFGRNKKTGFNLDLDVPFRNSEFWVDYNIMKNDPTVTLYSIPTPVKFSAGFHHEF